MNCIRPATAGSAPVTLLLAAAGAVVVGLPVLHGMVCKRLRIQQQLCQLCLARLPQVGTRLTKTIVSMLQPGPKDSQDAWTPGAA